MKIILICFLVFFSLHLAGQEKKLLAPTPPMGWNSWNWFGKNEINEDNMKQCMDAIVAEGLLDAGYEYFIIDGGWRDTKLGPNGELIPNPEKFPNGIKPLADYAHSLGLKFGLHTVPGTHDCGGDPVGGFGHEEVQIQQFVDWGVDFIKLDKCKYADGWNEEILKKTYEKWHNLLSNCGRDIILSISAYKFRDWNPDFGQMSRTTPDIGAKVNSGARFDSSDPEKNFLSIMAVAEQNNETADYAGEGYWNDPDMLVVGNPGLTIEEQKAHFALWCIMSSPLILGNDPRNMNKEEKEIITNKLAININQDPTEQGRRVLTTGNTEVWAKTLKNGDKAVLLLNRDEKMAHPVTISLEKLGIKKAVNIQEVFSGEELKNNSCSISREIGPHSCSFLFIHTNKNE